MDQHEIAQDHRPLAETMRPQSLDQFVGQSQLVGEGAALRQALLAGRIHSMVLWGPPGTGKSQVVTDLLINAAWQGKKILFASKNNKAVDVVETRVNSLGPRPILVRVGSNQYQAKLAEYLLDLLSTTANDSDASQFEQSKKQHGGISPLFPPNF